MAGIHIGDAETFAFHVEINQLLSKIINIFLCNREIFLGQLISHSNEALEKIRVEGLADKSKLDAQPELYIRIVPDKTNNTLSIIDSGIGMTKADLVNNLGTTALSGTWVFIQELTSGMSDVSVTRHFGVGFYSAYLVAEKVTVTTKHNDDEQYIWESQAAAGSFSVTRDVNGEQLGRGTKITLFLNKGQLQYLEESRIKDLVKKHSEFISYPMYLWTEDKTKKEEEGTIREADEDKKESNQKFKEASQKWELIIKQEPIWLRNPEEITKDEYALFYKRLTNYGEDYLAVKHFSVEGRLKFKAVLFVPKKNPFGLSESRKKMNNIKLYVRRVFITENCEELMPEYLGFIKGVVDSDDLPLNISHEMLQRNKILQMIREKLVQKCIEMFYEIAENKENYTNFYEAFSKNLELGFHEDSQNRAKLADLLRYQARMKDVQTVRAIRNWRTWDQIKNKGYPYLTMVEHVINEYGGQKIVHDTKEGLKLDNKTEEEKKKEEKKQSFENFCKTIEHILGHRVEKVVVSDEMVDSPCGLVTGGEALKDHAGKKTMEINPDNGIIKELRKIVEVKKNHKSTKYLVHLLFETALLTSGFSLDEHKQYASRIHWMLRLGVMAYKNAGIASEDDDAGF